MKTTYEPSCLSVGWFVSPPVVGWSVEISQKKQKKQGSYTRPNQLLDHLGLRNENLFLRPIVLLPYYDVGWVGWVFVQGIIYIDR